MLAGSGRCVHRGSRVPQIRADRVLRGALVCGGLRIPSPRAQVPVTRRAYDAHPDRYRAGQDPAGGPEAGGASEGAVGATVPAGNVDDRR